MQVTGALKKKKNLIVKYIWDHEMIRNIWHVEGEKMQLL